MKTSAIVVQVKLQANVNQASHLATNNIMLDGETIHLLSYQGIHEIKTGRETHTILTTVHNGKGEDVRMFADDLKSTTKLVL